MDVNASNFIVFWALKLDIESLHKYAKSLDQHLESTLAKVKRYTPSTQDRLKPTTKPGLPPKAIVSFALVAFENFLSLFMYIQVHNTRYGRNGNLNVSRTDHRLPPIKQMPIIDASPKGILKF